MADCEEKPNISAKPDSISGLELSPINQRMQRTPQSRGQEQACLTARTFSWQSRHCQNVIMGGNHFTLEGFFHTYPCDVLCS